LVSDCLRLAYWLLKQEQTKVPLIEKELGKEPAM